MDYCFTLNHFPWTAFSNNGLDLSLYTFFVLDIHYQQRIIYGGVSVFANDYAFYIGHFLGSKVLNLVGPCVWYLNIYFFPPFICLVLYIWKFFSFPLLCVTWSGAESPRLTSFLFRHNLISLRSIPVPVDERCRDNPACSSANFHNSIQWSDFALSVHEIRLYDINGLLQTRLNRIMSAFASQYPVRWKILPSLIL